MPDKKHVFVPDWLIDTASERSFRSLFKWGALDQFKHPNHGLYRLMKDTFEMSDADFQVPQPRGLESVNLDIPVELPPENIEALTAIVGANDLHQDAYIRINAAYGKGTIDTLRLRQKQIENIPDAVLAPRSEQDIQEIISYCTEKRIPVYIYGAGSTVTRGMEAVKGGICLDMSVHMNRLLSFNEQDQTITVESGMTGPQLEQLLNNAPQTLNAQHRYTCGHFPQSFEFSSVGGWVVTRGAGQNSTYYGKIEDIVISQTYITPTGLIKTKPYPRQATGPDIDQIMMGSEGTFGVLSNVTLRVFRYTPEASRHFSFMFHNWEDGLNAVRESMQAEFGFPSVFRLSDPEETDVALKLYGIDDTPASSLLDLLGFKPMQRCLLLGSADGDADKNRLIRKKILRICRSYHAFDLTPFQVTRRWEKGRFRDPYLREDLQDFGIMIDTLECAVTWSQLQQVYTDVRRYIKSRPQTICMTHLSHLYPQGSNLYFIFIARINTIKEYLELQYGILETMQQSGAAISHHHGLGKQTAPWLVDQMGDNKMGILTALKQYFDPYGIMNPGGTLGFDMTREQKEKRWGIE